ncbi:MarR family winged helix-turn-helix transcriptional regulator [Kitasatospora sp. NPDC050543]|uniref:MarR family winged helix-turn-helix transcriptional regulator n=1 Tax=Kitasatospora sp. NPDC050543 TaxID=3364054 RepID=UPI0037B72160
MTRTTPPPAPVPSTVLLMDRLAGATAGYYRRFAAVAAAHGLTPMQGKMLGLLRHPMPMRALADLLGCDASNVTGIVDRLEARGLARREADPADRRIKNVLLTEEGEAAVRCIRAEVATGLPGLEQLDESERRALGDLLARVFPTATG